MISKKRKNSENTGETDQEFNALHAACYQMCGVDDTVYNFHDKTSQCLPRSLSIILQNIQGFTTAPELIERLSRAGFRGIDEGAVKHCIRDLHESGLLITKEEALARLRSAEAAKSTPKISTAAWITRDRPDSLIASIESFAANFRTYGHALDFFVSDDSTDESGSENLSNRLAGMAAKNSISLTCMGRRERRKLRDAILEKAAPDGLPADVLDFAMFGLEGISLSYGANRNAVLLANAGEMILCSDDDVFCDLRVPEKDGYDFELATRIDPDFRESFPDRDMLLNKISPAPADILALHGRLLGRHIAEILGDFSDNDRIKMKNLSTQDLTLHLRKKGTVKTTVAGVSGDSGMVSPRYLFWLRGDAREQYTATEETFRVAHQSKEVFQASSHFAAGGSSYYLGMNIGIDNRSVLPPYIPILRGEDTIFSRMLRQVTENALIGTLPVTILHNPVNHRLYDEHPVLNPRPEMCEIFILLIQAYRQPIGCDTQSDRIIAIGKYFTDIGSLPLEDFEEHVKQLWLARSMYLTTNIEQLLNEYAYEPAYWADYLEKYIINLRDYSYGNYITAIVDLYDGNERATATICRDTVRHYGELLKWWPAIFSAAKDIRGNG